MINRKFFVSLFSNLIAMIISLGVSFILTPFLINNIGKEAYSFFPIANNFAGYLAIITMALNSMASRFFTVSRADGNTQDAKEYFSSVFIADLLLAAVLMIPMLLIVCNINSILDIPYPLLDDVRILFICVFLAMLITLVSSVFGIAVFACERMDLYALQNIGLNLIRGSLYVILFSFFSPAIKFMGYVILAMAVYNACFQFVVTKKLLPDFRIVFSDFSMCKVVELLKSGVWNSMNNLGVSLLMGMSLLVGNVLIGADASGDLSIVQTLPNFMTTVISTVFGVILPNITVTYAKGIKQNTKAAVLRGQKILGIIATVPCVLIIILGKHFFELWVPMEDSRYLQILSVITILPLLLHSMMWIVYGLNIVNNKVRKPAIVLMATGIVNIAITVFLVKYTSLGAVAISLSCTLCCLLYYFFYVPCYAAHQMKYPVLCFYPFMVKSVLFSALFIIICMSVVSRLMLSSWLSFFLTAGCMELCGLILYVFIVLDKNDRKWLAAQIKEMLNYGRKIK